MSLDALKPVLTANPDVPDGSLQRVRALDVVAACDAIAAEKRDKLWAGIRYGSANYLSECTSEDRREAAIVIIPIAYIRHLAALAGG